MLPFAWRLATARMPRLSSPGHGAIPRQACALHPMLLLLLVLVVWRLLLLLLLLLPVLLLRRLLLLRGPARARLCAGVRLPLRLGPASSRAAAGARAGALRGQPDQAALGHLVVAEALRQVRGEHHLHAAQHACRRRRLPRASLWPPQHAHGNPVCMLMYAVCQPSYAQMRSAGGRSSPVSSCYYGVAAIKTKNVTVQEHYTTVISIWWRKSTSDNTQNQL